MVENRGGFLSAGGDLAQLAAPGTHAFSPGRVAKGAGLGDRPRTEEGQQSLMDIYLLLNDRKLLRNRPL